MNLYAENILEHYRNPRCKSPPPWGEGYPRDPNDRIVRAGGGGVITHSESNPACGDEVTVEISMKYGIITELHWDGTGCAISQAAMSMLSEELEGKTFENIDHLTKDDVLALLGVPIGPRRLKCALLGLHACKNALRKVKGEKTKGWAESVLQ